jgi:nitroreductase
MNHIDTENSLALLMSRRSAVKLADPGPGPEAVRAALDAAARAPDHGKLRPWRFIMIEGAARAQFGEILADYVRRTDQTATPALFEAEKAKAFRAPLIVAVVAKIDPQHPKIPAVEQLISTGAAAQNLWLAFHAQGYACMWKTGGPAYDPAVKRALGLAADDAIVGFIYVGTLAAAGPETKRPDGQSFATKWSGAPA